MRLMCRPRVVQRVHRKIRSRASGELNSVRLNVGVAYIFSGEAEWQGWCACKKLGSDTWL